MAYSTVPKVRRDGVIQLEDGTGVPVTLQIAYEEGNFTCYGGYTFTGPA